MPITVFGSGETTAKYGQRDLVPALTELKTHRPKGEGTWFNMGKKKKRTRPNLDS